MLVDLSTWERRKVEDLTGMQHGIGQCSSLRTGHATPQNCHQPRGGLIIRDVTAGVSTDPRIDLGPRQFHAIPLSANDIDCANSDRWTLRLVHWKRNPSGRSSVMCACFGPFAPWKKTVASGPNS